jgi:hypothetical protein
MNTLPTLEQIRIMNTRPTPETDAFAIKFKTTCGEKYWVPVDIARKLERELAEARGQRDRLAEVIEAASVLIAAKGRHNTMLAYNGLRDALQSLTQPNYESM